MTKRVRHVGLSLILVLGSALAWPNSAFGGEQPISCGPLNGTIEMPAAPRGKVAYQELRIDENCELQVGQVQFLDMTALPNSATTEDDGVVIEESFDSVSDGAGVSAAVAGSGSGSGTGWSAQAVQRWWDCCGIKMTEYWIDFSYNKCGGGFCSPYIRTYSGRDGGAWHREGPAGCCGGWSRESGDHYLYICGGGVGYTSVSLCGHQGYSYKGVFDQSGTRYYNSFSQTITGRSNSTWSCTYGWNLRNTAPGWHAQNWCVTGLYSG